MVVWYLLLTIDSLLFIYNLTRPTFYYWNAFFLIFLITVASLSIFSIRCHQNQNRIQTTCTLLLTSVTFKWITNRSLPTISYMVTKRVLFGISMLIRKYFLRLRKTSLDKYSIICILLLCKNLIFFKLKCQVSLPLKLSYRLKIKALSVFGIQ